MHQPSPLSFPERMWARSIASAHVFAYASTYVREYRDVSIVKFSTIDLAYLSTRVLFVARATNSGDCVDMGKRPRTVPKQRGARTIHVTTIRVWKDQWDDLQQRALDRRRSSAAGGRIDASAILREVLDRAGIGGV